MRGASGFGSRPLVKSGVRVEFSLLVILAHIQAVVVRGDVFSLGGDPELVLPYKMVDDGEVAEFY